MGLLHYRDPATGNWVPLSVAGPAGPQGPVGEQGPPGDAEEVWVGPNAPVGNNFELWLDTDDTGAAPVDPATVFLSKSGGAMSGPLLLAGDPQAAKEAATRDYVDAHRAGRNRIINGDFSVNQRRAVSIQGSGFVHDRWSTFAVGGTCSYSSVDAPVGELPESARSFARIVASGHSAPADKLDLRQYIESVRTLSGKTVTVSFWARAASGAPKVAIELFQRFGVGDDPTASPVNLMHVGKVTLSTQWARYQVSYPVPSIAGKRIGANQVDCLALALWVSGGSDYDSRTGSLGIQSNTFDFWGVQVEEGAKATPYEQRPWADELRACQRYYTRFSQGGSATRYVMGIFATPDAWSAIVPLPTPMHHVPTVSSGGKLALSNSAALLANDLPTPSRYDIVQAGPDVATVGLNYAGIVGSTATPLGMAFLEHSAVGEGFLAFEAEL